MLYTPLKVGLRYVPVIIIIIIYPQLLQNINKNELYAQLCTNALTSQNYHMLWAYPPSRKKVGKKGKLVKSEGVKDMDSEIV